MNKLILILGFFLAVLTIVVADDKCPRQCQASNPSRTICARDSKGKNCRKVKECQMREDNCRLRLQRKPEWKETNMKQCRKGGKCGKKHRSRSAVQSRRCDHPCTDDNRTRCFRSNNGQCQMLTYCQVYRVNCQNVGRELRLVDIRQCGVWFRGNSPRRCR